MSEVPLKPATALPFMTPACTVLLLHSHTHTLSQTHSHTLTHAHTLTHTLTLSHTHTEIVPWSTGERGGDIFSRKMFKTFALKMARAKARIWPCLACSFQVRSTLAVGILLELSGSLPGVGTVRVQTLDASLALWRGSRSGPFTAGVRTGSWTGPPRGKRAPRVRVSSTVFGVRVRVTQL